MRKATRMLLVAVLAIVGVFLPAPAIEAGQNEDEPPIIRTDSECDRYIIEIWNSKPDREIVATVRPAPDGRAAEEWKVPPADSRFIQYVVGEGISPPRATIEIGGTTYGPFVWRLPKSCAGATHTAPATSVAAPASPRDRQPPPPGSKVWLWLTLGLLCFAGAGTLVVLAIRNHYRAMYPDL